MKNKILSDFIVALLLLCFCFPYTAEASTNENKCSDNIEAFLKTAGIFDISFSGEYVTKGEFAHVFMKLLGDISNVEVEINDLKENYSIDIKNAVGYGYMSVDKNKNFYQNENISGDEALNSLLKLTGYEDVAKNKGSYQTAVSCGILKNTSLSKNLPIYVSDFIYLIYNTAKCDVLKAYSFGKGVTYKSYKGENILGENLGIYYIENQIVKNEYSGLYEREPLGEGRVKIGNDIFFSGDTGASFLLGYNVRAYYKTQNKENTLIWIETDRNDELYIYAEEIKDFSNRRLSYYTDEKHEKSKTMNISQKIRTVYNGVVSPTYTKEMILIQTGDITFIDGDKDGIYDIMIIASYKNIYTDTFDFKNGYVTDKNDYSKKVTWKNDATVEVYDEYYNKLSPYFINSGTVLSIAKSIDGSIVNIIANLKSLSGEVAEKYTDSSGTYVYVENERYKLSKSCIDNIKVGDYCDFYFDADEKIAAFSIKTDNLHCGYLKNILVKNGINETLKMKIFENEMIAFECKLPIIIDGEKITNGTDVQDILNVRQLILFKLDKENKIYEIDSAFTDNPGKYESTDSLYLMSSVNSSVYYKPSVHSFSGKFQVNDETKFFVLPVDKDAEDKYSIKKYTDFGGNLYGGLKAYSIGNDREFADYVVYDSAADANFLTDDAPFYLVSSFSQTLYKDKALKKIYYYDQDGIKQNAIVEEDCNIESLKSGDLIQIIFGDDNMLHSYVKAFDVQTKTVIVGKNALYNAYIRAVYTNVYKKFSSSVLITDSLPSDIDSTQGLEYVTVNSNVFIFDEKENNFTVGSIKDIKDYLHENSDYSKLYIRFTSGLPKMIIIYK